MPAIRTSIAARFAAIAAHISRLAQMAISFGMGPTRRWESKMPQMLIELEGDAAWPDLQFKPQNKIIHFSEGETIKVAVLDGGMASGKPSVMFRIDLPNGRTVLAETSARLFVMAAAAIVGRWPD